MNDTTTPHQNTANCEKEAQPVNGSSLDRKATSGPGSVLTAAVESTRGELPDRLAQLRGSVDLWDSLAEASEEICSDYPELAAWLAYRLFLNSLTSTADGMDERLASDQEECDRFAPQLTSSNRSIKQDAGRFDRMFESACHAAGTCGAKIGIEPLKEKAEIKKLKASHKPYEQCRLDLGT